MDLVDTLREKNAKLRAVAYWTMAEADIHHGSQVTGERGPRQGLSFETVQEITLFRQVHQQAHPVPRSWTDLHARW